MLGGLAALQPTAAQDDFATVQAGVQQLFTATAQASAYSTFSLTVDAMFHQAQTETATAGPSAVLLPTETPLRETRAPTNAMTMTSYAQMLLATTVTPTLSQADLLASLGGEVMRVDGGTFQMGTTPQEVASAVNECVNDQGGNCQIAFGEDSAPPHVVTVSGFGMERLEVTYGQYLYFLNTLGAANYLNGCVGQRCVDTRAENENSNIFLEAGQFQVVPVIREFPVANVTWFGADAYCRTIGRRLPTEAEWEHAARGYNNFIYPWGNEWNPAFAKTSISPTDEVGALPVGSLPSGGSAYSVLDMAGNVAEWVSDWYDPTYYTNPAGSGLDPKGPPAGEEKVVRGGSWDAKPFFARSVHRQSANPFNGYAWVGFRCVEDFIPLAPTEMASTPLPTPSAGADNPAPTVTATPLPRATITTTLAPPPIRATPTATPT
jgi:formylglycine-generating enzyme required for sulfatase activity